MNLYSRQPVSVKAAIITGCFAVIAALIMTLLPRLLDRWQVSDVRTTPTESVPFSLASRDTAGSHAGGDMATVWLTYAWVDNADMDVDYVAQELKDTGVNVKLDRWSLKAGRRLWEQIERFITDPSESDGWILFATKAALQSEPCKEEFAYALDRALQERGGTYPLIALVPESVDASLLPAAIRTRLYVSLSDPDWMERIVSSLAGQQPNVTRPQVAPYVVKVYRNPVPNKNYAIEMRPRTGSWSPFVASVPYSERDRVHPSLFHGPRDNPPRDSQLFNTNRGPDPTNQWWVMKAGNPATSSQSYYLYCAELPTRVVFGVYEDGSHQYLVEVSSIRN